MKAWRNREAQSHSLLIKWTETRAQPSESNKSKSRSLEDFTIPSFESSLLFDGLKARYESRIITVALDGTVSNVPFLSAFDGELCRSLNQRARSNEQRGTIAIGSGLPEWNSLTLKAPLVVFRPLSGAIQPVGFRIEVRPGAELVNGVSCVVVNATHPKSREVATLWCDLSRNALPLRFSKGGSAGGLTCAVDFTYGETESDLPALVGWEANLMGESGEMVESVRATKAMEERSPKIDSNSFTIEFPPGAVVWDKRATDAVKSVSEGGDTLHPYSDADVPRRYGMLWAVIAIAIASGVAVVAIRAVRNRIQGVS
jgi:hypothetical protein